MLSHRAWRLAGAGALFALLMGPALPGAAGGRVLAHAQLVASSPGSGTIVPEAPDEIRLERIWLDVYDDNARGRHVYERLGFVQEATFRRGLFRHGRYIDVHRMALLRDEWSAAHSG